MESVLVFPMPRRASNKSKARKFKFTEIKIGGLRHSGGGPEYVYDTERPGLALRLTSGGAHTFVFVGRLHGKVERVTLGRAGQLSLASARAAVDKIRGDAALGIDVIGTRKALRLKQRGGRTLHEAFADFVAGDRHKAKTAVDYKNLWSLYLGRLG